MKYMGNKSRIVKDILPIMLKGREEGQYWVEPFVGGGNVIKHVKGNRIGGDSNKYLIALLQELQKGIKLEIPYIDKSLYKDIKENKDNYPEHIVGFSGTQLSFGAQWFGSYRRDNTGKRDYFSEAVRGINKEASFFKGIDFRHEDYSDLVLPENSIIYCDPPYNTPNLRKTHYVGVENFCHKSFWEWAECKTKEGHTVFVSEYSAPKGWVCLWEKEVVSNLNSKPKNGTNKETEKLFKFSPKEDLEKYLAP